MRRAVVMMVALAIEGDGLVAEAGDGKDEKRQTRSLVSKVFKDDVGLYMLG